MLLDRVSKFVLSIRSVTGADSFIPLITQRTNRDSTKAIDKLKKSKTCYTNSDSKS